MTSNGPGTEDAVETEYRSEPVVIESSTAESSAPASSNQEPVELDADRAGGGVGGFLKRLFLAFVKVALALLVVAALAIGAWLIFLEINRSFDSVVTRIDRNTRRIEESEAIIDSLEEENYAQQVQVAELEAAVATRESEISALEEELQADLSQQGTRLAAVEEDAASLATQAGSLGDETSALSAGLVALQEDLNANGQQIDELGGTVDGLSEALAALDSRSAELEGELDDLAAEELAGWRRAVALFRAWQMIGRARLRLLENNLGLAASDIELAIVALDDLLEDEADQPAEDLTAIRERLVLAGASLPDQPQVAGRDLETAWEALDVVVSAAVARPAAEATPEA